jgi:hypothetical protein
MNPPTSQPPATVPRSAWPKAVAIIAVVALLMGGAVFIVREMLRAPAKLVDQGRGLVQEGGRQLRSVMEAFNRGTVRTEFLSHATEVAGTSRFQFAMLKQNEVFKREETGATAWGWVPLPRVVVQAQAPVEYSYSVDFAAPWQIEREGDTVRVFAPPIEPHAPAIDVSALTFYTLEGSIWRDESAVREKLRQSLSAALKDRARTNEPLVREIGRQRCTEFFEKWLASNFHDAANLRVKVIFPDERAAPGVEKPPL